MLASGDRAAALEMLELCMCNECGLGVMAYGRDAWDEKLGV